ncbi:MAG TPA: M28 family metallopeptidase [Candidatus Eisenbacteria bacterium]|nr:M28 family metallopeptidase [Candidatus Eisenbacteria bacterium]
MRSALVVTSLALLTLAGAAPAPAPPADPAVRRTLERIRPEALRGHMRFLADDRLEGRGTGTPGFELAAAYMAAQFEGAGLEPGGPSGSWFQRIPFRRLERDPASGGLVLVRGGQEQPLAHDTDFILGNDAVREESKVSAPLAFAGFGVTAPEMGYDDFAHVDPRGKVLVLLSGAPKTFPSEQRAYYSNNIIKTRNAVEHGAIGIITVRTPGDEARAPWERVILQSRLPGMRWLDANGVPNESHAEIQITATMSRAGARTLFADAPVPLDQVFAAADSGRAQGFPLPVSVRAWSRTRHARAESPNVVGLLRGSDPKLRDEVVVFTAHLDHLGIGVPVKGDSIHNGAYDNATGCGALVELARAFAALPQRPKRSLLFVAVTGEEKGLQGSDYFARFPTVPAERLVADINMDMFLMLEHMPEVIVFGGEHSTLGASAERAARAVGLKPVPDPMPEEVIFVRSDQFSFVRQGIPSAYPVLAGANRVPAGDSLTVTQRWRRTIYHSPQDDMSQPMDFESGARFIRMQFLLGLEVANAATRPAWKRGDFFEQKFAGKGHAPAP